jgi:hypothetical protein
LSEHLRHTIDAMVSRRGKTPELQSIEASFADMSPELRAAYERMHAREMTFRQELFERHPTHLVNEIPGPAGKPVPASLVRHWLRKQDCFAYCHAGRYRFPAYQFANGVPKPLIRRIILCRQFTRLPKLMSLVSVGRRTHKKLLTATHD